MEQMMSAAGVDKKPIFKMDQGSDLNDRRKRDRRRQSCKGFTQIVGTVGWVCHREAVRRKDDPIDFF